MSQLLSQEEENKNCSYESNDENLQCDIRQFYDDEIQRLSHIKKKG